MGKQVVKINDNKGCQQLPQRILVVSTGIIDDGRWVADDEPDEGNPDVKLHWRCRKSLQSHAGKGIEQRERIKASIVLEQRVFLYCNSIH